jgi:two-component system, OmpR family, sensor histidine kinase MprB
VPFRRRLSLAAAVAVAVAVLLAFITAYFVVRGELRSEVDDSLRARANLPTRVERILPRRDPLPGPGPAAQLGGAAGYVQLVAPDGRALRPGGGEARLPVDDRVRKLARSGGDEFLTDASVSGQHVRVLAAALPGGGAVQVARPLGEVDSVLSRLRLVLAAVLAFGIALAVALGRAVTRAALAPVERLTEASEHVAATRDLSRRIEAGGNDELGRLASSFNTMLDALERSVAALDASSVAQRQLVADASHELRTPLTSLRTNVEVLRSPNGLPEEVRRGLVADVGEQIDELTELVGDLIQLARGDEPLPALEDVRLDVLVAEAVDRARRHAPAVRFRIELEPTVVDGVPDRLERAATNLLGNAAKFSPSGDAVDVALRDGVLSVRDRGPGIAGTDLPHVFDRFYRAEGSRGVPGSGLGLAIVKQVAEAHGGWVEADAAEGGGSVFRLGLPAAERAEPPAERAERAPERA